MDTEKLEDIIEKAISPELKRLLAKCHALALIILAALAMGLAAGYQTGEKFLTEQVMASTFEDSTAGYLAQNYDINDTPLGTILKIYNTSIPEGTYQTLSSGFGGFKLAAVKAATSAAVLYTVSSYTSMVKLLEMKGIC